MDGRPMRVSLVLRWAGLGAALLVLPACSDSSVSGDEPGPGGVPPAKKGLGVGGDCSKGEPCRTGLACGSGGTCEPAHSLPVGDVCTISAECEEGLYCSPQHLCATAGGGETGASCASDLECKSGLKCIITNFALSCQPEGSGDIGASCTTSVDCFGGLACQAGTCTQLPPGSPPYGIPVWAGETCTDDPTKPTTAYFEVPRGKDDADFYRLPFPNDIRIRDGHPDLTGHPTPGAELVGFDPLDRYLRAIEKETEGWGIYPTVIFRFSDDVDWTSFDNNVNPGALQWIDITPNASTFGWTRGWASVASGARTKYICPNWMSVRPPLGAPMIPGHTYAVVLKTDGKAGDGTVIKKSPDFEAMLKDTAPVEIALQEAYARYQIFRDYLNTEAVPKDLILNAAVFTVGQVRSPAEKLAAAVAAQAAPVASSWVRCGDGPSPCPQADGERACGNANGAFEELHALVTMPIFQHGTAPYLAPADGGGFEEDANGGLKVARSEQVCMSLTIPKGTPMPMEGWPLVIYAHGTGGSFRSQVTGGVSTALSAADAGSVGSVPFAVLGIDQVQHGPRRGSSTESPNDLFFNFANPFAAKYNALQGAADQMTLVRLAQGLDLDASASPTGQALLINPSRITFWGHSQGATEGSIGIPYTQGVRGVVLSGNGASLMDSLTTKTSPVNIAAALPFVLLDFDDKLNLAGGIQHPALSLLQLWIDSSDPLAYAPLMTTEPIVDGTIRHVFQPFGQRDTYSTGPTQLTYIVTGGLGRVADDASTVIADPNDDVEMGGLKPGTKNSGNIFIAGLPVTALTRRYGPDGYDGHFVAFQNPSALADVARFLGQSVTGPAPPSVGP